MDYLELAKQVVAKAARHRVDADAYIRISQQSNISVDRAQVEKLSHSGSKGIGLRVLRDGKMGYAYTSDFGEESLADIVDSALALMEAADGDEYRVLPELSLSEESGEADEDLNIYDESILTTSMDDKVGFALQVEKAALSYSDKVAMTNRCTYLDGAHTIYLANSRGFASQYQGSFAASFVMAIGRDGDEQTQAFGLDASTSLSELNAVQIGEKAAERATRLLGGKPVPTQQVPVVFDPIVTAGLLGTLAQALNAEAMQRGRSYLADKMGQEVACDMVTLLDNGRLPGGLGSRPFDDEGVPTRATRLVDEGILQAVIYDTYTANKAGTQSTGNALRDSHRTPPTLAPSNFYLQPGQQSPEEIIASVENGFYVVNAMNTGGINPVAGEYSSAASGLWIENGELTYPVNEVTIAASLNDMLHSITAVGNDLTFVPFMGSIGASTLRIDTMMVGGQTG